MPTLADYQASIPKCPGPIAQAGFSAPPCLLQLSWDNDREVWKCPRHGDRWEILAVLLALSEPERRQVIEKVPA